MVLGFNTTFGVQGKEMDMALLSGTMKAGVVSQLNLNPES